MISAEFVANTFRAVDELGVVEQVIEGLSQQTNDRIMLDRLTTAIDEVKHAAGYLAFVASRARAELQQQERQKDEIIRQYESSLAALRCREVSRS